MGTERKRIKKIKNLLNNSINYFYSKLIKEYVSAGLDETTAFLNEQSYVLEEYDEQLVRQLIEKVTVLDNNKLTIEFKSGVEIEI